MMGSFFFVEMKAKGTWYKTVELPCGRCVGCRLERSRSWAVRCVHEAQLHDRNCFVTLTYEGQVEGLVYRDFQLFMRRLRKVRPGVRFFMCGEYGEQFKRPHFHACLFNADFPDRVPHAKLASGASLFRSPELESLWTAGYSTIGELTFQSAAYVARYVLKKVVGQDADVHYGIIDGETGELVARSPEFCHMSLKPGIGSEWIERYMSDVYPRGLVVINGVQVKPPKYYDRRLKVKDARMFDEVMFVRSEQARAQGPDNTEARRLVREQVTTARLGFLKRSIK